MMQNMETRDKLAQGCWGHALEIKQDASQNRVHHLLVVTVQNGEGIQHICQCLHSICCQQRIHHSTFPSVHFLLTSSCLTLALY